MSLPLLNAVYRVSAMRRPLAERYDLLTIALREYVTEADAKNKMKKTVTRIWLNPPEPAAPMIQWALDNPDAFPDRRVMHVGAIVATVPYVGSIVAQLGRSFALKEPVTVVDLRRRAVSLWGASSTVDQGVGKTITSLRRLGIVEGGGRKPVAPCGVMVVAPMVASWLVHATMLTRQINALDVHEASQAPELFWAGELSPDSGYPFLEMHSEGVNRRVWVTR